MRRKDKERQKEADIRTADAFQALQLTEDSPFAFQEAFRSLRTNLSFSMIGKKVIGIISAAQHEGKTSTAINLGISFAQIGKKVLVVDCDLRCPTVAQKLEVPQKPGFTDHIIGQASFEEAIRRVDCANVDFMPAGTLPPDPSMILNSVLVGFFLKKVAQTYDLVIIDLPPVNPVADAAMLSTHGINGFIMVVRHGVSDIRQVEEAVKRMQRVGAELLGFVYNDKPVDAAKGRYYRYHYG